MKAIIIAAGPSSRLLPITNDKPKCMLEVGGKTIIQRQLETLTQCGIDDIVVVRGYKGELINFPDLRYYENTGYLNNNILRSLFYAKSEMDEEFVFSYSDIIYEKAIVQKLLQSEADISLIVDIDWINHYHGRHLHPVEEAELVTVERGRLIKIGKGIVAPDKAYMFEVQKAAISTAAYKAVALPLAGSLGAFCAGWLTDKYFQSRRAPVVVAMLFSLGIFAWLYPQVPAESWVLSLLCLLVIGFMTYGPHVLIVGIMPMDLGTRKASSSVTGFVDGFGYIGAGLTGVFSGWLMDSYGWDAAFNFWIAVAVIAGILMLTLWKFKPERGRYF